MTSHRPGGAALAGLPAVLRARNAIFGTGLALLWLAASAVMSLDDIHGTAHAGPFKAACVAISVLVFLGASIRATRQTGNAFVGTLTAAWVGVMATSIVWSVGFCASLVIPGATPTALSGIRLLFPSVAIVPGVAALAGGTIALVSTEGVERVRR